MGLDACHSPPGCVVVQKNWVGGFPSVVCAVEDSLTDFLNFCYIHYNDKERNCLLDAYLHFLPFPGLVRQSPKFRYCTEKTLKYLEPRFTSHSRQHLSALAIVLPRVLTPSNHRHGHSSLTNLFSDRTYPRS